MENIHFMVNYTAVPSGRVETVRLVCPSELLQVTQSVTTSRARKIVFAIVRKLCCVVLSQRYWYLNLQPSARVFPTAFVFQR